MNDVELAERLAHVEDRAKSNTKRIDDNENRLDELEKTYAIMQKIDFRVENVESNVEKINKKLEENSSEKGKKWDKLIDYVFYFVLCALLTYISTKLGF